MYVHIKVEVKLLPAINFDSLSKNYKSEIKLSHYQNWTN